MNAKLLVQDDELVKKFSFLLQDTIVKRAPAQELIDDADRLIYMFLANTNKKALRRIAERLIKDAISLYSNMKGVKIISGNDFVNVFASKQHDYGPYNIAKFGEVGIIVRLSDKTERLKHLISNNLKESNESIKDTLIDIANYTLILLLVMDNEWQVSCSHYVLKQI